MLPNPQQKLRQTFQQFYLQTTKSHPSKFSLKNKLKHFSTNIRKEWALIPQDFSIAQSKYRSQKSGEDKEMTSLKTIQSKQMNTLSISRSRSKLSKSRDSSKDISENDSKLFNCDWIYSSQQSSSTLLYAMVSSLIINDNKFAFKYFEDKINDQLTEKNQFSEHTLEGIASQWQRLGDLFAKSKTIRWQKQLKETIDKFPAKFTQLACRTILQIQDSAELFSPQILTKFAKEMKMIAVSFTINYRDIEQISRVGKAGQQIFIGVLKHSKIYVIANKAPEYHKEEIKLREIKSSFNDIISSLLSEYSKNETFLTDFKDLAQTCSSKEAICKEHFSNKFSELSST